MEKNLLVNVGDKRVGSILGSGRFPREGNGNLLQYSCLENSMDRPWGHKKSYTTEQITHIQHILNLTIYFSY